MTKYPPFQPTEYLFTKHNEKGESKAEIYAWAVRDIMAKTQGLELNELKYPDKKAYWG